MGCLCRQDNHRCANDFTWYRPDKFGFLIDIGVDLVDPGVGCFGHLPDPWCANDFTTDQLSDLGFWGKIQAINIEYFK